MSTTATEPDVFASDDSAHPDAGGSRKAPDVAPEDEKVKDEGSTYIVLRAYVATDKGIVSLKSDSYLEGEVWQSIGSYVANNGNAAIRKCIKELWSDEDGNPTPGADGWFATVPFRSFSPAPVAVKQPPATLSIGS